tara:strand:- start:947 stop:1174 length:228 start_codon:yes stop_codon:yes gene_type:complete
MLLTALINLIMFGLGYFTRDVVIPTLKQRIASSKNQITWSNWAEEEAERQYQSEINNNIRLEHEQYQRDWKEGKI